MHIGNQSSQTSSHFDNGRHNGWSRDSGPQQARSEGLPGNGNRVSENEQGQHGEDGEHGESGGNRYTVQHGDSLWQISDRMRAGGDQRGNWDIVNEIARDNGIKNPDLIFPGNTLNLRGPMSADSFVPAKDPSSPITGNPQETPGAHNDGIKWIGQLNPAGADGDYTNAEQNCGPAVMAMLARKNGQGGNLSDADLITSLGKTGHTDASGTTGNGLIAMADQMGLKSEASPGANSAWVMSQLAQGKSVVANGDYYALPQHADANKDSAHYVLLTGLDANGNIKVEDPMDGNVRAITPGQLDQFNSANPEGGFNIAFG